MISKRVPELRRHTQILQHLGPKGMSDDEREEREGDVSYRIQVPLWRNAALIPFLRTLDRLSAIFKENETVSDRRGNPVHVRISGGVNSVKKAVRGLPANAYSDQWKERLSDGEIFWLAEGPDYDFRLDHRVSQYVPQPSI
jgi:hypothetical protein